MDSATVGPQPSSWTGQRLLCSRCSRGSPTACSCLTTSRPCLHRPPPTARPKPASFTVWNCRASQSRFRPRTKPFLATTSAGGGRTAAQTVSLLATPLQRAGATASSPATHRCTAAGACTQSCARAATESPRPWPWRTYAATGAATISTGTAATRWCTWRRVTAATRGWPRKLSVTAMCLQGYVGV
jgi:hypothetical protein